MTDEKSVESNGKITRTLIFTVFLTCFGSSMLLGYNIGVINLPADRIKCFLNTTILYVPCKDAYNTSSLVYNKILVLNVPRSNIDADFLYAQTSTSFVVAAIIGAFNTGWVADVIGRLLIRFCDTINFIRRNGLLINHIFVLIGGLINGLTVKTGIPALLYVGRFFIGINSGITIGLASMYLTEIAPRMYRGAIGACHQLAVTLGIVLSYILTMSHTLNTDTLWPVACACTVVPALISLALLPLCPESPRFIFLKKNNEKLTRKEFLRINQMESVDLFIDELGDEIEKSKNQPKFNFCQLFTQKDLRMPVAIACIIQVMQQLSGINAVISYSSSMLSTAGIPDSYSQYCVIGIGLLNVICTLSSLPLLEKFGRRTLLLWPSVILAISLLLLTITVNLVNSEGILSIESQKIVGTVSVVFIMTYIVGFAFGLGPVSALIVAEIFRQEPRGAAYSISQAVQWTANLIVLFSYPNMNKAIGGYSFLPFLVVVVICWVFFFIFMPETKNRTIDEVVRDLAFGRPVIDRKKIQHLTNGNGNKYTPDDPNSTKF